jgi:hypothetical protein
MREGDKGYAEVAGTAEIIVAKQRNGPIGDFKLNWVAEYTRFQNMSDKRIDEYDDFAAQRDDVDAPVEFNADFND